MPYWNISSITNHTTNIVTMSQQVNEQILFGWGFVAIHAGLSIIMAIAMLMITNDAPKSFMAVSFFMALSSVLLLVMSLVPVAWVVFCIMALAVSLLFFQRRGE
jgi:hypothetical protein